MRERPYAGRLAEFRKRLIKRSIDTAWIVQPENRRYLSGYKAQDAQLTESSGSLLINKNIAFLLTDSRFTTEAETEAVDFEVYTLKDGIVEELPGLLERMETRSLGFEENYVTWGLHNEIAEKLGSLSFQVDLVSLDGVVESMREIKDAQEIKALKASGDLIATVLEAVVSKMMPGMTEKEVAWQIEGMARERGADELAFPSIVASGPNGALPHAVPTDRKLKEGEPIVLDVGVKLDGYCSDMTRTVFLGEPKSKFKNIYNIVRRAQMSAMEEVKAGNESVQPDKIARDIIKESGYGDYFGHGLGHGVGLATHESPRIGPRKSIKLKKGMIVTVEPGIYLPGKGGVRLEQMVVVEERVPRILTGDRLFYDFTL
ncbi:aminopeptidase P family protein [Thermodesulfobacteriota bacterium]